MTEFALPLTQSDAFERTCNKLGLPVTRMTTPLGTCLVQSRKLPVIGNFHLISRGPVLADPTGIRPFLRHLKSLISGPVVVNAPVAGHRPDGIKLARGADIAITELMAPSLMRARLHQKWRNQLKKAEASDLVVTDQPLTIARHSWFLEAAAAQQKSRRYKSYPGHFLLAFAAANKGQARLYSALLNGQPVAGMLVLKHGLMATYQAGVTTPEGRRQCAHNLLLWNIMCDLQRRGVQRLDLGRADLSPGLHRFKMGSGAEVETLAGSFLSHTGFATKAKTPAQSDTMPARFGAS